ncbi:MAG: DUF1963 domain-containing protein [Spirochaetales bacterium]|nr:DUF1963 domain-containing protein [Spirochaetales bacterium]
MKQQSIIIKAERDNISSDARIGGHSFLPEAIEWPQNENGEKLVLIASIPLSFIKDKSPADSHTYLSVFSTYSREDYFLDAISYHGNEAEFRNINGRFTKVLLHAKGKPRTEADILIPGHCIELEDSVPKNPEHTGSRMGGDPGFLQRGELHHIKDYNFVLQLYGGDFPEGFEDIFYLSDAVGYLFLKDDSGLFFAQAT